MLEESYKSFLSRKLERGLYDDVVSRLNKHQRVEVHELIIEHACQNPEKDKEFMDRVGDQIVKRVQRNAGGDAL